MIWDKITKNSGLKNIGILGSATIAGNAVSAIVWLFFANLLGPETYGEINYFVTIALFASSISLLTARRTITVYTAKQIKIQPPLYLISLCSSVIASMILFLIYSDIGMSLIVGGLAVFNLTMAEMLGRKIYKTHSKFYVLQKILFAFFAISLYFILGPQGIILGIGISYLPFFYLIKKTFRETKLDFNLLKNRVGFIISNYFLMIIEKLRGQVDILIIGPLFGFTLLGNYNLGIQFFSLLTILPLFVVKYTLSEDATGGSTNKIKIITVIFSIGLALLGVFVAPFIIQEIFPQFTEALDLIPIMSMAIIPYTVSYMYMSKFIGQEKTKPAITGYASAVIVLIIGIIGLGETLGAKGLAVSLVLAYLTQAFYLAYANYSQRER